MDTIIRNVCDIASAERQALENVIGRHLQENEQVRIHVVATSQEPTRPLTEPAPSAPGLPEWSNVFEGLADEEIAEIERVIRERTDLTRVSD